MAASASSEPTITIHARRARGGPEAGCVHGGGADGTLGGAVLAFVVTLVIVAAAIAGTVWLTPAHAQPATRPRPPKPRRARTRRVWTRRPARRRPVSQPAAATVAVSLSSV